LSWLAEILEERDYDFPEDGNEAFLFEQLLEGVDNLPTIHHQYPESAYAQVLESMHQQTTSFLEATPIDTSLVLSFMQMAERVILLLALVPYVRPELLDFFRKKSADGDRFVEFGGVWNPASDFQGFLPTIQTAIHLLAGMNLERRALVQSIFSSQHFLIKQGIIQLGQNNQDLPPASRRFMLSDEYIDVLVKNQSYAPQYSEEFPATLLSTKKNWEDLILDEKTGILIDQAKKWVAHYDQVRQSKGVNAMNGYRLLMSGPSGTGKTFTAALLGKTANKPVYRIDISNIVDKYVGEATKRLRKVFDMAATHDWILFFDEGDALFGKRSSGSGSSNERYANQEVSYLLYKLEEYEGMIFLATNKGTAIDSAFERRFDSLIEFQKPNEYIRRSLWQYFFDKPGVLDIAPEINKNEWRELAEKGKVSGAWIEKFYQYCLMQAVAKGDYHISANQMRNYIHWYSWERGYFDMVHQDLFKQKN
jgi:hypothetical protein